MKPKWADQWVEEEFDYGTERGFMARVGDIRNAVRMPKEECVRPAKLSDTDWAKIEVEFMDDNGEYCTREEFRPKVLRRAKYKKIPIEEARKMAEESLHDWFLDKVKESRDFLRAAELSGLTGEFD